MKRLTCQCKEAFSAVISFNPAPTCCSRGDVYGRHMVVVGRRDAWHSFIKLSILLSLSRSFSSTILFPVEVDESSAVLC